MARRASSSTNPFIIIGIAVAVIAAIFAGKILMSKKAETFPDAQPLAIGDLLENGNSLRNNEYLIEGRIDERFFRDNSSSSVVSVRVKSQAGEEIVPVMVPPEFNNLNMEREQRYAFKVKFEQGGIPVATDIRRL